MINLSRMRQFYSSYPIFAEVPQKLSWTHWTELLKIDNPLERSFYLAQATYDSWSTTKLDKRKVHSIFAWHHPNKYNTPNVHPVTITNVQAVMF